MEVLLDGRLVDVEGGRVIGIHERRFSVLPLCETIDEVRIGSAHVTALLSPELGQDLDQHSQEGLAPSPLKIEIKGRIPREQSLVQRFYFSWNMSFWSLPSR